MCHTHARGGNGPGTRCKRAPGSCYGLARAPERGLGLSDFGKKLQAARLKAGLSQREVAERVGITVTTVSRYEITSVLPSVAMAAQLAQAVGVSLDQLTGSAKPDTELVRMARKLSDQLTQAQQEPLCAVLAMLLGPE